MRLLRCCIGVCLLLSLAVLWATPDMYCSFEAQVSDKATVTLHDLLNNKVSTDRENRKAKFYNETLTQLEREKPQRGGEFAWQNDYAVTIFELGRRDEAVAIWQKQLLSNAGQIEALGNLAAAAEHASQFAKARAYVELIVNVRPQLRAGAEKYRLMRLTYLVQSMSPQVTRATARPGEGVVTFWFPAMLEAWKKRPVEAGQWKESKEPFPEVSIEGLVEMLAYSPQFGDGWHVLAMVLEKQGNLRQASVTYTAAARQHPTLRKELDAHAAALREHLLDKFGSGGILRKALWFGGALALLVLLRYLLGLYRNWRQNAEMYGSMK